MASEKIEGVPAAGPIPDPDDMVMGGTPSPWPPKSERTPEEEEQVQLWRRATEWLRDKWTSAGDGGAPHCPYCDTRHWAINTPAFPATALTALPWSALHPVFAVICLNCGHTVFINAVVAGLVTPEGKPVPYQEDAERFRGVHGDEDG